MSQDVNQDWASRDFVEKIEVAMRKCVDFLNDFHEQARYRLSEVDQRLTSLERKVDFVDAQLLNADPSKRNGQPKSFKGSTFDPLVRKEQVKKFRDRWQKTQKVFSDRIIAPRKADSAGGKLIVGGPKKAAQTTEILGAPKSQGKKGNIPIAQVQQQMKQQKELQKQQSKEQQAAKSQSKPMASAASAAPAQAGPPPAVNPVPPKPMAQGNNRPPPSAAQAQKDMAAGPGSPQRAPPSAAQAQKAMAMAGAKQPGPPQPPGPPMIPPAAAAAAAAAAAQPAKQAKPQPPIPNVPEPPPPGASQPGSGEGEGTYPTDGGPGAPGFPHGDPGSIDLLILTPGDGNIPAANSKVEIQYTGYLADGSKFIEHKEVIALGLKQNIKGLEAGVQRMQEGTHAKLWIPSKLAYGVRGAPPLIPGNSDLTFDIKILKIVEN